MTSPHRHSPLTSLAWSHCAPTPQGEDRLPVIKAIKLTVSMIPLPVGVTQWHRWVPVGGDLTLNLTDLRSWLLNCRSSPAGESYGSQLTGWAVTQ